METRQNLIAELKKADSAGNLLVAKHDPNSGITWSTFRTVLTPHASASLSTLINSEAYELHAYFSNKHKNYCYALLPYASGSITPVGLGLPSGSLAPSGSFDTFLITSGSIDGWHVYAADSQQILTDVSRAAWDDKGLL